jgi:hypothetical protein
VTASKPILLIVSSADDVHALSVAASAVDIGLRPFIFDTSRYPNAWSISTRYGDEVTASVRPLDQSPEAAEVELPWPDVRGIWYRRFQPFGIPDAVRDPEVRNFCISECREVFFSLLESHSNIINKPGDDIVGGRKPYQLGRAAAAGLHVPETLITNDPAEAREFWERLNGQVVFKILSNTRTQFTQTRVMAEPDLDQIEAVRFAPTIFQRRLEPAHHLRITVVDEQIFGARLTATREEARYDWRLDRDVGIEAIELEPEFSRSILALMRDLNLRYGALDFIVTEDGQPWFLEVNTSGQFLFVEIETKQPISRAIAAAILAGPDQR